MELVPGAGYSDMPQDKYEKDLRLGFIRKVFGILSSQLLLTTLFVVIGVTSPDYQNYVGENIWLILVAAIGTILIAIALICSRKLARSVPTNYLLLALFTICEAVMLSSIVGFYDPTTVLIAALMTLAVTITLTTYALTTKTDFSTKYGIIFVCVIGVILFAVFMPLFYRDHLIQVIVCSLMVVVYGVYLVIDTQIVAGGGWVAISTEDYIVGAIMIYVDIIGLFIYLLKIFGFKK